MTNCHDIITVIYDDGEYKQKLDLLRKKFDDVKCELTLFKQETDCDKHKMGKEVKELKQDNHELLEMIKKLKEDKQLLQNENYQLKQDKDKELLNDHQTIGAQQREEKLKKKLRKLEKENEALKEMEFKNDTDFENLNWKNERLLKYVTSKDRKIRDLEAQIQARVDNGGCDELKINDHGVLMAFKRSQKIQPSNLSMINWICQILLKHEIKMALKKSGWTFIGQNLWNMINFARSKNLINDNEKKQLQDFIKMRNGITHFSGQQYSINDVQTLINNAVSIVRKLMR